MKRPLLMVLPLLAAALVAGSLSDGGPIQALTRTGDSLSSSHAGPTSEGQPTSGTQRAFEAPPAPRAQGVPGARQATAKVELGRLLFWDPILSGNRDVACATCHHPDFAYTDGRALSRGPRAAGLGPEREDLSGAEIPLMRRNAPTILNTAFNGVDDAPRRRDDDGRRGDDDRRRNDEFGVITGALAEIDPERAPMFWDRRVRGLEAQALEPLKARDEMRGDAYPEDVALDSVVARLRAIPEYVALFQEAFGASAFGAGTVIDETRLAEAIAEFERTLVAVNSPFDRFQAGDEGALTPLQRRGLEEFDDADCTECHEGPMLSDFELHAEGVAEHPLLAAPDTGDGRFRFRTPSLRNVALTPPYMHNGTLETLEDVLEFYDRGRSENPNVANRRRRGDRDRGRDRDRDRDRDDIRPVARLDRDFRGVDNLSEGEMREIIAFLGSLTDENFDRTIPESVPSGLPPGGTIQPR